MKSPNPTLRYLLHSRQDSSDSLGISIRAVDYLISTQRLASIVIGRRRLIKDAELVKYARRDHPGPIVPPETRRKSGASSRPELNDVDLDKPQPHHADGELLLRS